MQSTNADTVLFLSQRERIDRCLVGEIRTDSPHCSRARISFKTNVCQNRGEVLTAYPIFGHCSG